VPDDVHRATDAHLPNLGSRALRQSAIIWRRKADNKPVTDAL
jgi:hypothetical protein